MAPSQMLVVFLLLVGMPLILGCRSAVRAPGRRGNAVRVR